MNKYLIHLSLAASVAWAAPAVAQTVFSNDVSIKGAGSEDQLCIGDNCADDEVYGQNRVKIRLRDEDLAIEFVDETAGDPNWIIQTNQNLTDNFSIGNQSTGTIPFQISDTATANTLYLGGLGRVGIGTTITQANLHISSSFQPAIRLEQNSSQGFTQRTWEIAANQSQFLIQDVNFGSTPFTISTDLNPNAFKLTQGGLGLGVNTPSAPLHVVRNGGGSPLDMMRLENNGGVVFRLKDTSAGGQEFTFQSNGGIFRIASPAIPGPEFTMDDFGNVTIKGEITTAGSCSSGCDRVFDESYDLPDMTDHHAAMWELGHLPNVGPTAEDGPMNLSEKVGGILNELEHAHIFIDQLNARSAAKTAALSDQLGAQSRLIAQQAALIASLQARLDALEAQN